MTLPVREQRTEVSAHPGLVINDDDLGTSYTSKPNTSHCLVKAVPFTVLKLTHVFEYGIHVPRRHTLTLARLPLAQQQSAFS